MFVLRRSRLAENLRFDLLFLELVEMVAAMGTGTTVAMATAMLATTMMTTAMMTTATEMLKAMLATATAMLATVKGLRL